MTVKHTISALAERKRLRVAGLMSGTSADGVDVAIVDFKAAGKFKLLAFGTVPYPPTLRKAVLDLARADAAGVDDLCHLNFVLGEFFAHALIQTARRARIALSTIHLVGSHGQTIRHLPDPRPLRGCRGGSSPLTTRSTLQIGEPSIIAERTGITTVADFRPRDVAAGGQGAPLVPYADFALFADARRNRAVQNIGGIANVTWLPAAGGINDVLAFDTGPGNMIIDRLAQHVTAGRLPCDLDGRLAAAGRVDELLAELMKHPYLRRRPPKTTGREMFGWSFADDLYARARRRRMSGGGLLATATAFTARSIVDAYRRFLGPVDEVILCGGGARNPTLVRMLRNLLAPARVAAMDDFGLDADAKEAVSFALLAVATICGLPNNVPAATGAAHGAVLGKIVPGRWM